jgi:hypothetical protein
MQMPKAFYSDWNPDRDVKKLQYTGTWGGMKLSVTLINFSKDMFELSIESPFFNVKRELMKKDLLIEVEKVFAFLKYDPKGHLECIEKITDALGPHEAPSAAAS